MPSKPSLPKASQTPGVRALSSELVGPYDGTWSGSSEACNPPPKMGFVGTPILSPSEALDEEEIILKFGVERLTDLEAVIKCHMLALTH